MDIDKLYKDYERKTFGDILERIEKLPNVRNPSGDATLRKEVFTSFINKLQGRKK